MGEFVNVAVNKQSSERLASAVLAVLRWPVLGDSRRGQDEDSQALSQRLPGDLATTLLLALVRILV